MSFNETLIYRILSIPGKEFEKDCGYFFMLKVPMLFLWRKEMDIATRLNNALVAYSRKPREYVQCIYLGRLQIRELRDWAFSRARSSLELEGRLKYLDISVVEVNEDDYLTVG